MSLYSLFRMGIRRLTVAAGLAMLLLPACGARESGNRTLSVPEGYPTIQSAVDAARPGDFILVAPGVYNESVKVDVDQVVIRGLDRNEVIVDGGDRLNNGFEVSSDSVAIENLTVRSFTQNGVLFSGALRDRDGSYGTYGADRNTLVGYRVSHVTTYNNGLYGIYAFASRNGTIEHSYASGHPDSGLYVGQCRPCNVVIRSSVAENNAIGYYGTNASTNVWVVESLFRGNRLGITPNSQDAEMLSPQAGATIAANLVVDNDNADAPEIPEGFFGGGIIIGGGLSNLVTSNVVSGHSWAGIAVMTINDVLPADNQVVDNRLVGNQTDLVFLGGPSDVLRNCFRGNQFVSSLPRAIESVLPCGGAATLAEPVVHRQAAAPRGPSYRDVPHPVRQETMSNPTVRPVSFIIGEPIYPSLAGLIVPTGM